MSKPELVVAAVIIDDDRLLLVRHGHGPAQGPWSLPGGLVAEGELLAESVVRNLDTQTGIEGVCGPLVGVIEHLEDVGGHQVVLGHRVALMDAVEPKPGPEVSEARWVRIGDVIDHHLAPGLAEFLHDHQVIATIT